MNRRAQRQGLDEKFSEEQLYSLNKAFLRGKGVSIIVLDAGRMVGRSYAQILKWEAKEDHFTITLQCKAAKRKLVHTP